MASSGGEGQHLPQHLRTTLLVHHRFLQPQSCSQDTLWSAVVVFQRALMYTMKYSYGNHHVIFCSGKLPFINFSLFLVVL